MGVVISSVVAAGPAVIEDLETPYDVLVERRNRGNSQGKQSQKHRLRRQNNQIHFEALNSKSKTEEKKNKPGQNNRSLSRISQNTASRPQSRNNPKTPLKRQNSLDQPVSPRQPLAQSLAVAAPPPQQPLAEQPQVNNNLSVTEKIRLMLTTPREKKKLENTEQIKEDEQIKATTVVVEGIVNEMYTAVDQVIAAENLDNIAENIAEDLDRESDTKAQSTKSSVDRSSVKITNKEKIEMIRRSPWPGRRSLRPTPKIRPGRSNPNPRKTVLETRTERRL